MAVPTTDETQHYGDLCRAARNRAGLSLEKARDRLRDTIPARYVPSIKTLHRIELGEVPEEKVDGLLICGLARVYGCKISDLSPMVAQEYERLGDLLASSSPWIPILPGQLALDLATKPDPLLAAAA